MKKLVLSALCALATLSAYAQGSVNFANVGPGLNVPVAIDGNVWAAGDVSLWAGASADSLASVASTSILANGLFSGGAVSIDSVAPGADAWIQISVVNDGVEAQSNVFSVSTGGAGSPPAPPAALSGLTGFELAGGPPPVIPEPSTIALAVLGGAALLIRRRK